MRYSFLFLFFFFWVLGFEEEGHGWFGREAVRSIRKRRKKKFFLVLMPFAWVVKLDRCQNFK